MTTHTPKGGGRTINLLSSRFNNPQFMGHRIFDITLSRWVGFGYSRVKCDYRNWITTDFTLRLGFVTIEGWIP